MDSLPLQGWNADPFGLHELRYFSAGNPTKLVRDSGVDSYDEPPAHEWSPAAAVAGASAPSGAGAAVVGGRPGSGYRDPASLGRTPAPHSGPPAPRRRTGLVYSTVGLVAVIAVIVFVAVYGGFSTKGGSHSGSPGANLAAFVTRSARQTLAQKTADISLQGTVDENGQQVDFHGTGQADFATNIMAFNVSTSVGGTTIVDNEIVTSQDLYLQLSVNGQSMAQYLGGRHWFEVPLAASSTQATADSPDWSLQLAGQQGARVTPMGTQNIGGMNCDKYVVTPTRQAMLAAAQQEWTELGLSASQTAAARQSLENSTPPTLTVWFNPERQLACQVDVSMQFGADSRAGSASGPSTESAQALMTFTHYGVPVTVTPPPPTDTVSL
jgi:hypothetical protein